MKRTRVVSRWNRRGRNGPGRNDVRSRGGVFSDVDCGQDFRRLPDARMRARLTPPGRGEVASARRRGRPRFRLCARFGTGPFGEIFADPKNPAKSLWRENAKSPKLGSSADFSFLGCVHGQPLPTTGPRQSRRKDDDAAPGFGRRSKIESTVATVRSADRPLLPQDFFIQCLGQTARLAGVALERVHRRLMCGLQTPLMPSRHGGGLPPYIPPWQFGQPSKEGRDCRAECIP